MIGKEIKKRRVEIGMSQKELAKGITSQSVISRIEKGETEISLELLFKISEKLNFPIESLLSKKETNDLPYPYIDSLLNEIDTALLLKDFMFIIKLKSSPFLEKNNNDIILNGLISVLHAFYILNDISYCQKKLEKLVEIEENVIPELKFRIFTFLAFINTDKDINKSFYYLKKAYKLLKINRLLNSSMLFFYQCYAKILYENSFYEESNTISKEGLDHIFKSKLYFFFEELVFYYIMSSKKLDCRNIDKNQIRRLYDFSLWLSNFNDKEEIYSNLKKINFQ